MIFTFGSIKIFNLLSNEYMLIKIICVEDLTQNIFYLFYLYLNYLMILWKINKSFIYVGWLHSYLHIEIDVTAL